MHPNILHYHGTLQAIKDATGTTKSGLYWLNPASPGGAASTAFQAFCEMVGRRIQGFQAIALSFPLVNIYLYGHDLNVVVLLHSSPPWDNLYAMVPLVSGVHDRLKTVGAGQWCCIRISPGPILQHLNTCKHTTSGAHSASATSRSVCSCMLHSLG